MLFGITTIQTPGCAYKCKMTTGLVYQIIGYRDSNRSDFRAIDRIFISNNVWVRFMKHEQSNFRALFKKEVLTMPGLDLGRVIA